MDTPHYTFIQWKDTINNVGSINAGYSEHSKFEFINAGRTLLFILNARTNCGCTVTDFLKDPVLPGRSGLIRALYKRGSQSGEINKTIIVITNTKESKKQQLIYSRRSKSSGQ